MWFRDKRHSADSIVRNSGDKFNDLVKEALVVCYFQEARRAATCISWMKIREVLQEPNGESMAFPLPHSSWRSWVSKTVIVLMVLVRYVLSGVIRG